MVSFPELEQKILQFWQTKQIFKKTLIKDAPQGNFTFFEGPPTANGQPGVHHVLARAFKDLIPRYRTMRGYRVERKAGWDTHGLPVELQVEKELKISGKQEIEKYGVISFNEKCRQSVWQYQADWEKLTERIGFWLDMENPYVTYSRDYIESLWWIFKKIHQRGFLYKGHKVVPHCPRCGTALSSHEVAQGYKLVKENSVYLKFKLLPGQTIGDFVTDDETYILSWTTTPWTLPGNVALAVGKNLNYLLVEEAKKKYILVDALQNKVLPHAQQLKHFVGNKLIGIKYQPLFPQAISQDVPNYANAFKIYEADFVTTEDGTGVVHTAVMYGEDDCNLGLEVGLPQVHTVDEDGNFIISGELYGMFVKAPETEEKIITYLQSNNFLLSEPIPYEHDYPFCWRCSTPLLYYAKDSWFFKVSAIRDELIKANEKINWQPEHIKAGRFGEWLANIKDWAVSRERYWGTPLPIWQNEAGEIIVIGSYQELAELANRPEINQSDFDPHRPFIDEVTIVKDGQTYYRVKEVADCWFDSGSMPFAQHHVINDERLVELKKAGQYPADYIAEAMDQTRGWFYTLLAVATLLHQEAPYKNVICLGLINDKNGAKMSKSKGNVVDPWEVINSWGADALRLHLYSVNQPGETKNFDIKQVEDAVKKNFIILLNVVSFYKMFSGKKLLKEKINSSHVLDQWLQAKTDLLVKEVGDNLDKYNIFSASRLLGVYIDELSTWYVRRSRDRFKGEDVNDKNQAINTLGWALSTLIKVMAPFTPFIAEHIYQTLGAEKESVHLEDWPTIINDIEKDSQDGRVIYNMAIVRKIVELALAERNKAGIKIRQPLSKLSVSGFDLGGYEETFQSIVADEVNVKAVEFVNSEKDDLSVYLDTTIDDSLQKQGIARELARQFNALRKAAKLTVADKVDLVCSTSDQLIKAAIEENKSQLLSQTGSRDLKSDEFTEALFQSECLIGDIKVVLAIVKK